MTNGQTGNFVRRTMRFTTMTIKIKMTNKLTYHILALLVLFAFVACSDDLEQEPQAVDFCVRAAWQDGLGGGLPQPLQRRGETRTLSATGILGGGTDDIVIATDDYPATIDVHCSDGTDFTLTKGGALCGDHGEYWQYTPSVIYKDKKIERDDLTFDFAATIDGGDELIGSADKDAISEKTSAAQRHMLVTLHHKKALLRFAFKVSEKYNKVRYIRVTGINLNGTDCELVDKVLTTDGQLIGYAYIDPAVVTTTYTNTIQCTYNIYDKDPSHSTGSGQAGSGQVATDAHLTRKGVTAQNTFKLGSLKDASSTPVTKIQPGYYYDLNVTLNPDYLYVLAEHDNKHITIE